MDGQQASVEDDGGLGRFQARLAADRTTEQKAQIERESAVAQAFDEQRARVEKAVAAFLHAADEKHIEPESLVSRNVRQPQPKVRWWQNEPPEVWTPIFEPGYVVHKQAKPVLDGLDEYSYIILWKESGKTELEPIIGERPKSRSQFDGALPFHFNPSGNLEQVDLTSASLLKEHRVENIRAVTDRFVEWLAEYLEEPAIRGAAEAVNKRRSGWTMR
jgi:hypothetical protein